MTKYERDLRVLLLRVITDDIPVTLVGFWNHDRSAMVVNSSFFGEVDVIDLIDAGILSLAIAETPQSGSHDFLCTCGITDKTEEYYRALDTEREL